MAFLQKTSGVSLFWQLEEPEGPKENSLTELAFQRRGEGIHGF